MDVNETVDALVGHYGDGADGEAPTPAQWRRIISREEGRPFALLNLFKFNGEADYGGSDDSPVSGADAFQRYASVSIPAMQEAGGEFLTVAQFAGGFLGAEQDWDLVAIGKYPNVTSFLSLFQSPSYISAYKHRKAAMARQLVMIIEQ